MGMNQDIKLSGNDFSNVATISCAATLIAEIPMGKPSFPSHSLHIDHTLCVWRLHHSKGPARKMAWDKCHLVGHNHRIHWRRKELSPSPCLPHSSGHVWGCHSTLFNDHNRWIPHYNHVDIEESAQPLLQECGIRRLNPLVGSASGIAD